MKWQSIAPVDGAGTSRGILKYSARQEGYAGGGRHQPEERAATPQKKEKEREDNFLSSNPAATTEFQSLLKNLMENNEKMRKSAEGLHSGTRNGRLYIGAKEFGLSEGYILRFK